ncbi:unnamed protein product [Rotaria sp. Silwood1]|nr:unnamed protein product [Rotaria sp. Silwood1]CAF0930417.1 unnamed protein product [Rotaria sp. Silwood1]CAF3453153.1 unnamed protein product [Rotaria sp. Silwood1]CAF3454766.1 unnamed protein product [Rotaria sp. Silwood1]CAF4632449.1 unnamed protein product [Rotaria sp. Silwood1]
MSNKASLQGSSSVSSVLFHMSSSVVARPRSFFSQLIMTITVYALLIGFLPCISCSPTPLSNPIENNNNNNNNNNNKITYDSNELMHDLNDYHTGLQQDSSSLSSSVHEQPFSGSSSLWYGQPRTQANQFLMSHVNDNDIVVPKWFTQLNNNNDDDIDDYYPSDISVNKRYSFYNPGGYPNLKKRKQVTKPPMEVMNEIVNSIYLKR